MSNERNIRPWGVVLVAVGLCAAIAVSLSYPKKTGPGFDEWHYLQLLRYGWHSVMDGSTALYYASKSFPFLLVRWIFDCPGALDSPNPYYRKMILFNVGSLWLMGWMFARSLRQSGMGDLVWTGLVLLLCNSAFLNFYMFYPRLPDIFMALLGTLFLLGHTGRNRGVVWLSLLLTTLTSPPTCIWVVLYLSFTSFRLPSEELAQTPHRWLTTVLIGLPILALAVWSHLLASEITVKVAANWGNPKYFSSPVIFVMSVVAAVCVLWQAGLPLRFLAGSHFRSNFSFLNLTGGLLLMSSAAWAIKHWAPRVKPQDLSQSLKGIAIGASYLLSKPFPGPPSLILFYGVGAALALLRWKDFSRALATEGPGFAIAFSAGLMWGGLDGEVRHAIFLLPAAVFTICAALAPTLRRLGTGFLFWSSWVLSFNWLVFQLTDKSYTGERHLSAFGMCWSARHYVAALVMSGLTLALLHWKLRNPPRDDQWATA